MSADWPMVSLGKYCLKIGSGATPKGGKSVYLESGEISLIRSQNIYNDGFKPNGLAYITAQAAEKLSNVEVQPNDILLNITGDSVARVCLAPNEYLPARVNQHVAIIRPDPKMFDAKFLRYFLASPEQQELLLTIASAGATRNALTKSHIDSLEVCKPDLKVQRLIADQLYALDSKIQLNHQINQTLEQMAQAIFKSWFVDFEPVKAKMAAKESWQALQAEGGAETLPDQETWMNLAAMQVISGQTEEALNQMADQQPEQFSELFKTAALFPAAMQDSELGEIPEGWTVDYLSKLIQFNPNRTLKKGTLAPYLDMKNVPTSGHLADDVVLREMNSGTKFVNGDTLLARITPCLENGKTAYVDFLDSEQVGWGSTEYIVMRSEKLYPESISYFVARDSKFRQHAIQSMTGTSGRQRANAKALAELPWIIYPKALVEAFNRIATPYLKLAKSHGSESKSLSAMRDTLLPKLLSGELSVADLELVGEV